MFELRPYQQEALAALEDYWSRGGGNPLVAMATATGKSVIIAHLIRDISRRYPALRVLVVTHVLELIEQDVEHLLALWPDAPDRNQQRGHRPARMGRADHLRRGAERLAQRRPAWTAAPGADRRGAPRAA